MKIRNIDAIMIADELIAGGFASNYSDVSRTYFGASSSYLSIQKGRPDGMCGHAVVAVLRERIAQVAECCHYQARAAAEHIIEMIDRVGVN